MITFTCKLQKNEAPQEPSRSFRFSVKIMSLNMFSSRKETKDILLSKTKNFATFFEQSHTKGQEPLEFKLKQLIKTYSFTSPNPVARDWMIGLARIQVFNSSIFMTRENEKIELY